MIDSLTESLSGLHPLVILFFASVAALIFRAVPFLSYPFRLFFTMIHEMGHVFATRLTGGEVVRFSIARDGSGVAFRRGGADVVVIPAGYVGTAFFSAGLVILSGFPTIAPFSLGVVAVLFMLLVLLYGHSSCLTSGIGLAFGVTLLWIAWSTSPFGSVFALNLLAILGVLTSLEDLRMLRWGIRDWGWFGQDDATKMARRVGCSPLFWAVIWFVCSLSVLITSIWITWFRGLLG